MGWEAWYTLAVVVAVMVALTRDLYPPAMILAAGMVAVLAAGIVDPAQALSGFSNPAPVTIGALYVVSAAARRTGLLDPIVARALGDGDSPRRGLARLLPPVTAASAVFNNTPIVAMLVPQVERWASRHRRSVSALLMPLSFAAVLGGVVTLMGTATNVVVSGLLEAEGMEPLGFFEITRVGLPVAVLGLVALVVSAPRLLPERRSAEEQVLAGFRDFTVAMTVAPGGPLVGRTVDGAGLRHLHGVFLARIEHEGNPVVPVAPDRRLAAGDVLHFVGRVEDVKDLSQIPGLTPAEAPQVEGLGTDRASYFQAVVGPSSPAVGRSIREFGFRGRYQAAVVAIHRAGERIHAKLGDVVLRPGDTLLVAADPGWGRRWGDRHDFLLVSPLGDVEPVPAGRRPWALVVVVAAMVVTVAAGWLPLVTAALLAAALVVLLGFVTVAEARRSVDLDVLVTIAAAFGLAAAMQTSGLAATLGDGLVSAMGPLGPVGVLAGVVVATTILKELVTNNAAVLIVLPIALATAAELSLEPRGFALAVAVAAATPFLTPIGYQTNLMVYGPGGYRFGDYLRLGTPLTILVIVLILALVPVFWPL